MGFQEPVKRKLAKKGDIVSYRRGTTFSLCVRNIGNMLTFLSTDGSGASCQVYVKAKRGNVRLLIVFLSTTSAWAMSTSPRFSMYKKKLFFLLISGIFSFF